VPSQLKEELEQKLLTKSQKFLPSALLWADDTAQTLFAQYSTLPEYYPTNDEISLFHHWGADIVRHIAPGSVLVDLGCG
jgi:uncharacterized SAM-dependent methyltransferase